MSQIFVRERRKIEPGEKKPRLRVVAVAGPDLKVKAKHVRKSELEAIAAASGAQVVYLTKEGKGKYGQKP